MPRVIWSDNTHLAVIYVLRNSEFRSRSSPGPSPRLSPYLLGPPRVFLPMASVTFVPPKGVHLQCQLSYQLHMHISFGKLTRRAGPVSGPDFMIFLPKQLCPQGSLSLCVAAPRTKLLRPEGSGTLDMPVPWSAPSPLPRRTCLSSTAAAAAAAAARGPGVAAWPEPAWQAHAHALVAEDSRSGHSGIVEGGTFPRSHVCRQTVRCHRARLRPGSAACANVRLQGKRENCRPVCSTLICPSDTSESVKTSLEQMRPYSRTRTRLPSSWSGILREVTGHFGASLPKARLPCLRRGRPPGPPVLRTLLAPRHRECRTPRLSSRTRSSLQPTPGSKLPGPGLVVRFEDDS